MTCCDVVRLRLWRVLTVQWGRSDWTRGWRVVGGGRWEGTQTEIGDYKSDCLASDVSPLLRAKV